MRRNQRSRTPIGAVIRFSAGALLVTGVLASVTDVGSGVAGAAKTKSYTVEIVSSLTGSDGAGQGLNGAAGSADYFDYINSKGGINGHKIVYHELDDQSSATVSTTVARAAVAANSTAIMDASTSGYFAERLPVYQSAKIPVFSLGGFADGLFPWLYGDLESNAQNAYIANAGMETALGGSIEGEKVAVITTTSSSAEQVFAFLESDMRADGANVVSEQLQPIGATSFASGAENIIASGAQAVLDTGDGPDEVVEAKALISAGFKGEIRSIGPAADNVSLSEIDSPQFAGIIHFKDANPGTLAYTTSKKFGFYSLSQSDVFMEGFVNAEILVKGLEACGFPCGHSKLEEKLNSFGTFTVPGDPSFTPLRLAKGDHNAITSVQYMTWNDATKTAVTVGPPTKLGPLDYPPQA